MGLRTPSPDGQTVVQHFSADLAHEGFTTESGLARDVDSYACRGTVQAGGQTLAILGCGLDVIYSSKTAVCTIKFAPTVR